MVNDSNHFSSFSETTSLRCVQFVMPIQKHNFWFVLLRFQTEDLAFSRFFWYFNWSVRCFGNFYLLNCLWNWTRIEHLRNFLHKRKIAASARTDTDGHQFSALISFYFLLFQKVILSGRRKDLHLSKKQLRGAQKLSPRRKRKLPEMIFLFL